MAKINFPDSPTVDQEFVVDDNRTYVWDGTAWNLIVQGASPSTAAPTITIVTEDFDRVTFTLTNNDDNTAFITYDIDTTLETIELAAAATSGNITVALAEGTYTLTAYATVVGEVASSATAAVEIVILPDPEGYLELVQEVEVTSNTTRVDLTISATRDDLIYLYTNIVNPTGSSSNYAILAQGDTAITGHTTGSYTVDTSVAVSGLTTNVAFIVPSLSQNLTTTYIHIQNARNHIVTRTNESRQINTSNIIGSNRHTVRQATTTTISQISVLASVSNAIGNGSVLRIYKVKA